MRTYDILRKKRDAYKLSREEIDFMIKGYTDGSIKDYQMSAFLMAIFINKMDSEETRYLTEAMRDSGDTIKLDEIKGTIVDKHSTGGVADTTTLILGPLTAACGVPFAKMSGRGLGHTGGTLDKLDSIDGLNTAIEISDFIDQVNDIGISICGQTGNITPADKKIYALRDVTATVDNISLITSSIMSKKLAVDSDAILLDVKMGSGAFMKDLESAEALSRMMVSVGEGVGRRTLAMVTDMNQPLGNAIGNSLEVLEAIEILRGQHEASDLYKLSMELGKELLVLGKVTDDKDKAEAMLKEAISSGRAIEKFAEMVEHQGGNKEQILNPDLLPKSKYVVELKSKYEGYIKSIDTEGLGALALHLGAGRETIDTVIDLAVGMVLNKRIGDHVSEGEILITIHGNDMDKVKYVERNIYDAFEIVEEKVHKNPLVYEKIDKNNL